MNSFRYSLTLFFLIFFLGTVPSAYSMDQVKDWVNQVKPGTFEDKDKGSQVDEEGKTEETKSFSEAELKILTALRAREEELKRKEQLHDQKAKELKNLSQRIEQKLDQMRSLAKKIEEERQRRQNLDERDITRMVDYYEKMAPENTAIFFNQMDRQTATHIIMRMKPRTASAVMQLLDPEVAVDITERVTRFKANREELK